MKLTLQHMPARMRFMVAMLAMLGAMWAAIDLHQHENGLHQPGQCVVCSLEDTVAHGFTLHMANLPVAPWVAFSPTSRLVELSTLACTRLVSIRAPPFA